MLKFFFCKILGVVLFAMGICLLVDRTHAQAHEVPAFTIQNFHMDPIAVGDSMIFSNTAYFNGGRNQSDITVRFTRDENVWVEPDSVTLTPTPTEIKIHVVPHVVTCLYPEIVYFYYQAANVAINPSVPCYITGTVYDPKVKSKIHIYDSSMTFSARPGDSVKLGIPVVVEAGKPWPRLITNVKPPFSGVTFFYPEFCVPNQGVITFRPLSSGTFIDTAWLIDMHVAPPDSIRMILIGNSSAAGIASKPEADVTVYPNPVRDNLFIRSPASPLEELTVFDVNGQVITSNPDLVNGIIDCSKMSPGKYFLRLRAADGIRMRSFVRIPQ